MTRRDEATRQTPGIRVDVLYLHVDHLLTVGVYGSETDDMNLTVECLDCNEILTDIDVGVGVPE